MTFMDSVWEFIDTSLYIGHCLLVVLAVVFFCVTPYLLCLTLHEVREIRKMVEMDVTVIAPEWRCKP